MDIMLYVLSTAIRPRNTYVIGTSLCVPICIRTLLISCLERGSVHNITRYIIYENNSNWINKMVNLM